MTKLQYGTFTFENNPRRIELSGSNAIAAHTLPFHGTVSQNLGPRGRAARCSGEVFAQDAASALEKLAALRAACSGVGAAQLTLPTGDTFLAFVSRFAYTAQGDGRVLAYTIDFVEQSAGTEDTV